MTVRTAHEVPIWRIMRDTRIARDRVVGSAREDLDGECWEIA
jgi:hypothetical protein